MARETECVAEFRRHTVIVFFYQHCVEEADCGNWEKVE